MSLEHSPARSDPTAIVSTDGSARSPPNASDYWQGLIDEETAAQFLKLSPGHYKAIDIEAVGRITWR